jgi:hypothetical protein
VVVPQQNERAGRTRHVRESQVGRPDAAAAPPAASERRAAREIQPAEGVPLSSVSTHLSRLEAWSERRDPPEGRLASVAGSLSTAGGPAHDHDEATRGLATAVYVSGNTDLKPGHRYGIAVRNSSLQVLGPIETDPSQIALERPIAGMDARLVEGRLILGNAQGLVLAFMAVAGPRTQDVASTIVEAARMAAEQ